jgi:pyruvate kinase
VDDGVDAIMLAGETAAGRFPIASVQTLDAIIREAESIPVTHKVVLAEENHVLSGHGRALCEAALTLADKSEASAIVAITRGGKTARVLSALRPRAPIFAATDHSEIARRLALSWGVTSVETDLSGDVESAAVRIGEQLVDRRSIPPSAVIVVVSINPDLTRGKANFLKLQRVG